MNVRELAAAFKRLEAAVEQLGAAETADERGRRLVEAQRVLDVCWAELHLPSPRVVAALEAHEASGVHELDGPPREPDDVEEHRRAQLQLEDDARPQERLPPARRPS